MKKTIGPILLLVLVAALVIGGAIAAGLSLGQHGAPAPVPTPVSVTTEAPNEGIGDAYSYDAPVG